MRVDIFIEDKQVDTFKDETIQITDSIQNAQDPNKIFTSFSKQFSLPGTNRNNDIFKHFYDFNIVNGYDAKRKVKALIKINGIDFRKGFIQLNSVKLKNNKATSYNVFFTGVFSELKEVIRDDKLSDLDLSQYDHNFNVDNVNTGFQNFANVVNNTLVGNNDGDLCYPLITHTNRLIYENNRIREIDQNGDQVPNSGGGVTHTQLKPALRLKAIIDAIENKYGFTFDSNFFNSPEFDGLFMWLHRNKGQAVELGDFILSKRITRDNFENTSGDESIPSSVDFVTTTNESPAGIYDPKKYVITPTVEITGTGSYDVIITDTNTGEILLQENNLENNKTFSDVILQSQNLRFWKPNIKVIVKSLDSVNIKLTVEEQDPVFSNTILLGDYQLNGGAVAAISNIVISEQIPQMKVIDFLVNIFKMFNLTGTADDYGVITIKPLDDFIAKGKVIDLTNKVDISESTVSKVDPFSRINFQYAKQKTFLAVNKNIIDDDEFGSLTQDLNNTESGVVYTGGDYDVKIDFEHMLFERINDQTTGDLTTVQFGWFVDEKQEPTFGKPLVFYPIKTTNTDDANIVGKTEGSNYIRPSNSRGEDLQTINFGTETDEFNLSSNEESLFKNFYKNYVERVYDQSSRLTKISAYLGFGDIINYSLEDVIVIQNKRYSINKIDININTGKVELELLNL